MKNNEVFDFENLYKTYFKKAYRSTFLLIKNQSIAWDATQEAFIKAFHNTHKLKDQKKFYSWVTVIAKNKAINMLRKESKLSLVDNFENIINEENNDLSDPSVILEEKEKELDIINALDKLDFKYRLVIVLKYFDNMTEKEIAEKVKIPIGTVKSRHNRAKDLLKSLFRDSEAIK